MFVTIKDIHTHLYGETIEAVSGEDKDMLETALQAGLAEAKGFLSGRYDMETAYREKGSRRNPLLLTYVKDCAVWHYINIANPGVDYSVREDRYRTAIGRLELAQKGDFDFDLPPKQTDLDGDGIPDVGAIFYGSNPKRTQHY